MKLMYTKQPAGLRYRLFIHSLRRISRSFDAYHPVSLQGTMLQPGQRACNDRWAMIAPLVRSYDVGSVLDLGCAEGYFVRRSAEDFGCFSLGVDGDLSRILVAQNSALLDGVTGAAFALANIDVAFLQRLPGFDAVIFLSVMHHVMYEHGIDYARQLLAEIRTKTRKFLIFDMGQSNEINNKWARLLPDMGADPAVWIADFLRSAAYAEVTKIGETDSYQNEARRSVFLARP